MVNIFKGVNHPEVLRWCAVKVGATNPDTYFDPATARAVVLISSSGDIRATAVFDNWTANCCECTLAVDHNGLMIHPAFVRAGYEYIFYDVQKTRITMLVSVKNTAAKRLHEKLGHIYEGTMRQYYAEDEDALVFGITKSDYINSKWCNRRKTTNG